MWEVWFTPTCGSKHPVECWYYGDLDTAIRLETVWTRMVTGKFNVIPVPERRS